LREIFNEPGKALAQPAVAVAMRLLEISGEEAVVDGSIAELPRYFFYPHRIMWQSSQTGEWRQLGRGKTHFYGRLCMEHDIVATSVGLPEEAQAGDVLVFFDAGAYDQSMSYIFGQG
jgi:diaminopimelate decarboxylase